MRQIAVFVIVLIVSLSGQGATNNSREETDTNRDRVFRSGFLTGNNYHELSDAERTAYCMGWIDAVLISPLFCDQNRLVERIPADESGGKISSVQITSVIDKFLKDHPEQWHLPMNLLVYRAVSEAFPQKK